MKQGALGRGSQDPKIWLVLCTQSPMIPGGMPRCEFHYELPFWNYCHLIAPSFLHQAPPGARPVLSASHGLSHFFSSLLWVGVVRPISQGEKLRLIGFIDSSPSFTRSFSNRCRRASSLPGSVRSLLLFNPQKDVMRHYHPIFQMRKLRLREHTDLIHSFHDSEAVQLDPLPRGRRGQSTGRASCLLYGCPCMSFGSWGCGLKVVFSSQVTPGPPPPGLALRFAALWPCTGSFQPRTCFPREAALGPFSPFHRWRLRQVPPPVQPQFPDSSVAGPVGPYPPRFLRLVQSRSVTESVGC